MWTFTFYVRTLFLDYNHILRKHCISILQPRLYLYITITFGFPTFNFAAWNARMRWDITVLLVGTQTVTGETVIQWSLSFNPFNVIQWSSPISSLWSSAWYLLNFWDILDSFRQLHLLLNNNYCHCILKITFLLCIENSEHNDLNIKLLIYGTHRRIPWLLSIPLNIIQFKFRIWKYAGLKLDSE